MFITTNARNLHVAVHGNETKPALVLLHSLGTCAEVWDAQIKALCRDHYIICPDFRGHGLSELSSEPLTIEALANDIVAVVSALKLSRFHLAGVSIGGMVALKVAGALPTATQSLVVFDSSIVSLSPQMWRDRAAKVREQGLSSIADGVLSRWITPAARETAEGRGLATMLARTPDEAYAGGCDALASADCRPIAARLMMPTVIAVGAQDEATPPSAAKALAEAIPGALYREIAGAAHIPMFEQAPTVTTILREAIARS